MLFNSFDFIVFALIFFLLWPFARKNRQIRWYYIVLASFIFYGWWDWRFLGLIMISALTNFYSGKIIYRMRDSSPRLSGLVFAAAVVVNFAALGIFKYADFTVHNFNWCLNIFGLSHRIPLPGLILPVGISFYTLQALSYVWDIHRKSLRPSDHFIHFLAYLSMFPQLVAGPIIRADELLGQLETPGNPTPEAQYEGLRLIVWGYCKKVLIADNLAQFVVNGFFNHYRCGGNTAYWWVVMIGFSFQIYGDFCGYSDIARGLARWMGYTFPMNFRNPYQSVTFSEFWTRWHITLSSWFRDYVYISLGGNRRGKWRTHLNSMITMTLSGLWHGADWTFVLWGILHGVYQSAQRLLKPLFDRLPLPAAVKRYSGWLICFSLTVVAWVLFRAHNLDQACDIIGYMFRFDFHSIHPPIFGKVVLLETAMFAYVVAVMHGFDYAKIMDRPLLKRMEPFLLVVVGVASIFFRGPGASFIYFQF